MKNYSKLKKLVKITDKNPYLDSISRKELLKSFLAKPKNRLLYIFNAINILETKLNKELSKANDSQLSLIIREVNFYLEWILSNFPWWYKNYPILINKFYKVLNEYHCKDKRNILKLHTLLQNTYRSAIFKKYNKKTFFEKFLKNIDIYLQSSNRF